jgi:type 1 glutamine amidotransferase
MRIARIIGMLLAALAVHASLLVVHGSESPLRVLVVTGGHAYDTNAFAALFWQNPEISVRSVRQPMAQTLFSEEAAADYDLMVWYDMWQPIDEVAKRNLAARIREGKGLVALHHSIVSYQDWPEYVDLVGGRYHSKKWTQNGVERPASTYKHDVVIPVKVVDPQHPVTAGMGDFEILDETYGGVQVKPGTHVLLRTDEPTSTPQLAWAHSFGKGRVVYLQLGHDHQAYGNPHFQRLLRQAIQWVGKRK